MRKISIYTTISLWVAVLGMPSIVHAQFLDYGTDPSRLKWNQVALEHYSLIYPQGLDSMAYRYALYLENVYPHLMKTIGQPVKMSFPVVLHPASMIANGMVSWSPRRMELLTTPSYSQEAERWDKHLVTHESRHVLQTGKLMRGVFRPLYYLMGEQAAGVSSVFVPRWFFEGDAVGMETALTEGGRGRLPEFQMVYKAQLLSAKGYSFEKWYLGSYKDYTGDFYAFGYNLTSFARYKYGADIWERTTSRYIHHPFALPPFSKAFKHHTGIGFDQLFKDTYAYLRKEWESRDTGYDSPLYLSPPSKQYTSYKYPQAWKDSSLIALKTSLSDLPSLVALSKGSEQHLSYLGSINGRIVLHKERVYWLEHLSSIRWTHESHTVIKYYDLTSRRIRTLTPRRRYIAFALSDSTIAASLFTEEGESRIALIAKESGQEYKQYPTPGNVFIKDLAMGGKDTLYTLAVGEEGISLLLLNMQTGQWEELLQPTSANLTSPVYQDGRLFFESGLEGSNNLYCLDSSSRKAYRLSSARFGAFHPALSHGGKELLFSDY
ncbi:MAG: hypothetical protein LBQ65_10725, partial [Tannerellaceae bacterium]|nr:hypothetical protein [Tannerellaceae bacterium]